MKMLQTGSRYLSPRPGHHDWQVTVTTATPHFSVVSGQASWLFTRCC